MTIDLQLEKEELQQLITIVYSEMDRVNHNEQSTESVFNLIMKLIKYLPEVPNL